MIKFHKFVFMNALLFIDVYEIKHIISPQVSEKSMFYVLPIFRMQIGSTMFVRTYGICAYVHVKDILSSGILNDFLIHND